MDSQINIPDRHLLQKSAGKAGENLGLIEWADDLLFLRVYSMLSVHFGMDESLMRHWIQTQNKHLDDKVPANLLTTTEGSHQILSLLETYSQ